MDKLEEGINSYLIGDTNSAIKLLTNYMAESKSPSAQGYYYLGLTYYDIGKDKEAGNFFQKALELDPEKGIYHYRLGLVFSKLMMFQQAIPHLLKTIEQNREHVRAHFILGTIYMKNGDLDSATEQFKIVTKISPNYADGFYELGNSLYYSGNESEAKQAFEKTLELSPDHMDTYYKLGLIYSDEKMYDKALKYYSDAYKLGMKNISLLTHFVQTLAANGQKDKADLIIKEIEETFPESREVAKLKDFLL